MKRRRGVHKCTECYGVLPAPGTPNGSGWNEECETCVAARDALPLESDESTPDIDRWAITLLAAVEEQEQRMHAFDRATYTRGGQNKVNEEARQLLQGEIWQSLAAALKNFYAVAHLTNNGKIRNAARYHAFMQYLQNSRGEIRWWGNTSCYFPTYFNNEEIAEFCAEFEAKRHKLESAEVIANIVDRHEAVNREEDVAKQIQSIRQRLLREEVRVPQIDPE